MKESVPKNGDALVEANNEKVRELIEQLGYLPIETLEELGLSAEQIKQIRYAHPQEEGISFFKSSRADGTEAKAITRALPDRYIAADIFSPAFRGGHGANHDFNWIELKETLETAKDGKAQQ